MYTSMYEVRNSRRTGQIIVDMQRVCLSRIDYIDRYVQNRSFDVVFF
jgi:hypothetical protein